MERSATHERTAPISPFNPGFATGGDLSHMDLY
jgi:hypothetical protein